MKVEKAYPGAKEVLTLKEISRKMRLLKRRMTLGLNRLSVNLFSLFSYSFGRVLTKRKLFICKGQEFINIKPKKEKKKKENYNKK